MRLNEVSKGSYPGGQPEANEDRVGSCAETAWAIDGATGYGLTAEGDQNAIELVDLLAAAFKEAAGRGQSSLEVLRSGVRAVRGNDNPKFHLPKSDRPSAAGVVCDLAGEQLRFAGLGDTSLVAVVGDHCVSVCDVSSADREAAQVAFANQREGIRSSRARMNSADAGYWILSIDEEAIDHAWSGSLRVRDGDLILLATDGLLRLVEVYGHVDRPTLIQQLAAGEGEALVQRLRQLELNQRSAAHVKQHDDASWVLLRVEA